MANNRPENDNVVTSGSVRGSLFSKLPKVRLPKRRKDLTVFEEGGQTKAVPLRIGNIKIPALTENNRKLALGLVSLLVLVGAVALIINLTGFGTHKRTIVCSDDVLLRAAADTYSSNNSDLAKLGKSISRKADFQKDPNCLYVMMAYYLNKSDYPNEKKTYDQLQVVYDSGDGFSKSFGPNVKTMNDLKGDVAFLKLQADEAQQNSFGMRQP